MSKKICIIDMKTGIVEFEVETKHGYSLQYCIGKDSGKIHTMGQVMNGRYDSKRWIKNDIYYDTLEQILEIHKDKLERIPLNRILFLEDTEYYPKNAEKIDWAFRIKTAPKDLTEIWGYWYIIESREFWVEQLSDENIAARIFYCLKRIDGMGGLKDFEIMDWAETYAEFGKDWRENPHIQVSDILDPDFEWKIAGRIKRQVSLVDYERERQQREFSDI